MTSNPEKLSIPAMRYAAAVFELGLNSEKSDSIKSILEESPELVEFLISPAVDIKRKEDIIDRVFEDSLTRRFLKVLCKNRHFSIIFEILKYIHTLELKQENGLPATLRFVTPPVKKQLSDIEEKLCKKHGCTSIKWDLTEDPSLIGGFVLTIGGVTYDRSIAGKLKKLEQDFTKRR